MISGKALRPGTPASAAIFPSLPQPASIRGDLIAGVMRTEQRTIERSAVADTNDTGHDVWVTTNNKN